MFIYVVNVFTHYNQVNVEHLDNAFELPYFFVDQDRDYFFSFQFLSQEFDDHHEVFSNLIQFHVIHPLDYQLIVIVDKLHQLNLNK